MDVSSPDRFFTDIKSRVLMLNKCLEKSNASKSTAEVTKENDEILLCDDPNRFCLYPIRFHDIWNAYKNHKSAFWTAEEIDFSADINDWENKLTHDERYFIEHILAFFAGSDGIVLENLVKNFCNDVKIPEARCFYAFQAMIENIHSEVYSLMIDSFVKDQERKKQLFEAITRIPCVEKKAQWALFWINNEKTSFAQRLFAFGIVEGLFFCGSFCAIFWLKERGLMTQALGKSNEWISRDESLHTEFAILLYKYVKNKLNQTEAHKMMIQAVSIEEEFICESLPVRLIGMDQNLMKKYIRFCADRLLYQFGYKKLYNEENPFPFMDRISMDGKTNFFEQRVTEYSMAQLPVNSETIFEIDDLEVSMF
jgi:ribonucleoside-diphosphate reductase subunit M2